jgi:hypothetical protein
VVATIQNCQTMTMQIHDAMPWGNHKCSTRCHLIV